MIVPRLQLTHVSSSVKIPYVHHRDATRGDWSLLRERTRPSISTDHCKTPNAARRARSPWVCPVPPADIDMLPEYRDAIGPWRAYLPIVDR